MYGIKRQVCEHEPFKRKVVCLNTKIEYESITYAAKCIGTSLSNIICACSGKDFSAGSLSNGEKLVWEYEENYSGMTLNDIYKKIDRANNFQVVNLSTKEVFINASCAAQHYGKSGGNNIYQAIHGRSKSAYGYKWQYLNDYLKKYNLTNEEARNSLFFIK